MDDNIELFVTYDDTGALDGCFRQVPGPAQVGRMILIDEAIASSWANYRANDARDGVELAPVVAPAPAVLGKADYIAFMQGALDAKSQERGYDGILSLCTYATSSIPKFASEGQAGVTWRDAVWSFGYDLLEKVDTGETAAPTLDGLADLLPKMEWPA